MFNQTTHPEFSARVSATPCWLAATYIVIILAAVVTAVLR